MTNTSSCWEEVDSMLTCERLDVCIFGKVFLTFILDVMINSKDRLRGIVYSFCTYGLEPDKNFNRYYFTRDSFIPTLISPGLYYHVS